MPRFTIRDAGPADVAGLVRLEAAAFQSDKLSRRSFRRLIGAASARLRLAAGGGAVRGYALILFRAGAGVARLYSIAVAEGERGRGLADALLADAERVARRDGKGALRLEVRADNAAAIRLYERRGYRPIGRHRGYYADGADALRYEKALSAGPDEVDRSPHDSRFQSPYIGRVSNSGPAARAGARPPGPAPWTLLA